MPFLIDKETARKAIKEKLESSLHEILKAEVNVEIEPSERLSIKAYCRNEPQNEKLILILHKRDSTIDVRINEYNFAEVNSKANPEELLENIENAIKEIFHYKINFDIMKSID
ncbi:MAG: hypothetical protein ACP5P2_01275 [Candidatus Micrarchaeia archaeon]|jgi:hypothetical protein